MKPFEQLNGMFQIDGLFQFDFKFRHEFHDAYVHYSQRISIWILS